MPELPEVQTVVTTLRPRIIGKQIRAAHVVRSDIISPAGFDLAAHLHQRRITDVSRRGKKIVIELDSAERFYIHLGMSGRLSVDPAEAEYRPHTHFWLDLGNVQLRFSDPRRFGGVWWLGADLSPDGTLGPEPLTMRPAQLARRLSRTKRPIKNALMDQSIIAGLGNIYVDESLFEAGIHPLTIAQTLTTKDVSALNRAIKLTLRRALKRKGSTLRDYRDADGNSGAFQTMHRVYDCAGKPCKVCGTPIQRIILGGRSTHFCPKCQKPKATRPPPATPE